jgi:hypothetical protein
MHLRTARRRVLPPQTCRREQAPTIAVADTSLVDANGSPFSLLRSRLFPIKHEPENPQTGAPVATARPRDVGKMK